MPAIVIEPPQRNEQMWRALKAHIMRERQRKKQGKVNFNSNVVTCDVFVQHFDNTQQIVISLCVEQEADAEEERLRKERERQQKQDVMTLGETREQISNLENELAQLKEEKHQLFLQLKKVLNEDDRRQKLIKETRFVIVIKKKR